MSIDKCLTDLNFIVKRPGPLSSIVRIEKRMRSLRPGLR